MSSFLEACQNHADINKQLADLDAKIDVAEKLVDDAIADMNDAAAKDFSGQINAAITSHNEVFAASNPRSLNEAFKDSGITRIDRTKRDAEIRMEKRGFCVVLGNAYSINSGLSTQTTDALSLQTGKGIASIEELRVLLGNPDYVDPQITVPQASSAVSRSRDVRSVTGTYNSSGTIDQLREISKAFKGDLKAVKSFIERSWINGVGILWSMPMTEIVEASDETSTFDYDVVRSKLGYPAFDEDIIIDDRKAMVFTEIFISDYASRDYASSLAATKYLELGFKGQPQLFCRVVRYSSTEEIRNQSPVLRTSGFDGSRLGPNAYKLGMSVNGLARVIDVTGDQGSGQMYGAYTVKTVASAISRVFGPHLKVEGYGDEISITTTDRGPGSSISFFSVGDGDASQYLGINGLLTRSVANSNRIGGVAAEQSITLDQLQTATWNGGDMSSVQVTASIIDTLRFANIGAAKVKALSTGLSYWDLTARESQAQVEVISDICKAYENKPTKEFIANSRESVRKISDLYGFVDLNDFRQRDALAMFDVLGENGLADVLNLRPNIDELDIYEPQENVRARMIALVEAQIEADGIETIEYPMEIINAYRQNHGKIAYALAIYNRLDREYNQLAYEEHQDLRERFCAYVASLEISTESILVKSDETASAKQVSTLWDDIVDTMGDIFNKDAAQNAMTALVDYICGIDPETCDKVKEYWAESQEAADEYENKFADMVGNFVSSTLGDKYRDLVSALALINRLLVRAQGLVKRGREAATRFFQNTFNTNKTLPEVLEDLANLNYNVYGNLSWQTKFVSCYASGGGDALMSAMFALLMDTLNGIIAAINKLMQNMVKALIDALDVIQCLADKLMEAFSGYISYEMAGAGNYVAMGLLPIPVTFKLNCTANFGFTDGDPALSRELANLKSNLRLLAGLLQLQSLKYNQLDKSVLVYKSMEITATAGAAAIIEQIRQQIQDKLRALTAC